MSKTEEEAWMAFAYNTTIAGMMILAAVYLGWLACQKARQPIDERAAYLEGRWGFDHATAVDMARAGEIKN